MSLFPESSTPHCAAWATRDAIGRPVATITVQWATMRRQVAHNITIINQGDAPVVGHLGHLGHLLGGQSEHDEKKFGRPGRTEKICGVARAIFPGRRWPTVAHYLSIHCFQRRKQWATAFDVVATGWPTVAHSAAPSDFRPVPGDFD